MLKTSTVIVGIVAMLITPQADAIQCWTFTGSIEANHTDSPILPKEKAALVDCPTDDSLCSKIYSKIIYDYGTPNEKVTIMYNWGCFTEESIFKLAGGFKCTEKLEQSTASEFGQGEIAFSYTRDCLCCGDQCNDERMDSKCNSEPSFTHRCFGAIDYVTGSELLPNSAVIIPCTVDQTCSKLTAAIGTKSYYQWGCFTMPQPSRQCGSSTSGIDVAGQFQKVCTCCGDMCNGARMDSIVSSDASCITNDDPANNSDADQLIIIISAALGSVLFATFVLLGGAIFYIVRLRQQLAHGEPDRIQMTHPHE